VIHLTPRLREYDLESSTRKVEITVTDGELAFIGIPTPEILSAMKRVNVELERMEGNERS
jgi:hypothetical protein